MRSLVFMGCGALPTHPTMGVVTQYCRLGWGNETQQTR